MDLLLQYEAIILSVITIATLPSIFHLTFFLFRAQPLFFIFLGFLKGLLTTLLLDLTAFEYHLLQLFEAIIQILSLRFVDLTSDNEFVVFSDRVGVLQSEIVERVLVHYAAFE